MKDLLIKSLAALLLTLGSTLAIAQDGGLDIDVDINKGEWYENPWVWVGVGAFLLILALIMRGGGNK